MLNGGVVPQIPLTRSLQQGCHLGPSLFVIATHPLLAILSNLTIDGDIVGLAPPSRGQLVM